jgi:hypothetical protein
MHSQNMHTKNPCAFLADPDGIASLMPQAKRLLELRAVFAAMLPKTLAQSCSVANYKQGKIIVFAVNSAVAAKLKLMRPTLLEQLAKRANEVTGMEVQVQPPSGERQAFEKSSIISEDAMQELDRFYAQLPDSELKNAIGRIARRGRK